MLESLLVLMWMTLVSSVIVLYPLTLETYFNRKHMLSEYIHTQFKACLNRTTHHFDYEGLSSAYHIHFNENCHINMAQTIHYQQRSYIISLGNGRIYAKSNDFD